MSGMSNTKRKPTKTPPARERVRITLDLSSAGYDRLQRLAQASGVSSATVLRQALQLYEFVVNETADGRNFKSVDKHGKETDIRFLGYTD
jgi:hypothetical protein